MTLTSKRLIKYVIMGFIMVLLVDTMPRKGMSDDTVIFLNPITSSPPPAVSIFLDTSGSMTSLPCAVPDGEDACGIEQNNSNPYFKTQLGYDPNTDYGYDAGNSTCFDSNINPGGDGCYYGGTSVGSATEGPEVGKNTSFLPSGSHVYINTYFLGLPSHCSYVQSKGPGGNVPPAAGYGWADCGTITYFCNNKYFNTVSRNLCKNQLQNYGYWYGGQDYSGGYAFYTGNLLNFYPPKFVVTRKVMSDLITYNSNQYTNGNGVRFGIFSFNNASSGAETDVKVYPPCSKLGTNPTPGNYLNTLYSLTWDHSTPLAGAIVQVGAYFANNSNWYENLACNGSNYCTPPSGANLGAACSSDDSWCGCYDTAVSCEKNFLIVMTDGNENAGPNGLPGWPIGSYKRSTFDESACDNAPGGSCNIDEVAGFLNNYSIRPTSQAGCSTNINTYTIGFAGTAADGTALNTYALKRAADIGGGMFANAQNWQTLESALYTFFANIVKQTKTFGTPSLPQLLTAGGGNTTTTIFKTFIASFLPQSQTFWVGHLREYTGAVDPTTGTIQVYDSTGKPFSGNTSAAGQCSFSEIIPPPIWDAGADLSDTTLTPCNSTLSGEGPCYLAPNLRNVFTVTPALLSNFTTSSTSNGDTTWSAGGDSVLSAAQAFTTSNTNLQPSDLGVTDTTTMDHIIDYVLGPKQDGVNVLGDIFHSDPTLVSADALSSDYLGSSDVAITQLDYQTYLNAVYSRPQIVVAGADDGMVHAFFTGAYTGGAQLFNGTYEPYTAQFNLGTGQEVWAFVPYDLLQKLQYMYNPALVPTTTTVGQYWTTAGIYITTNTQHVYYVDGSPFVRDVFLQGVDNGLGLSGNAAYWHTVMIIGERLGGTYYICLDITDTLHPKFMWEFTTKDMGFTFSKIAPHGPSIGPVYLDFDPVSGSSTSPQLRWVVMFNGGWDPGVTTNRGRGFYVVDIATGKLLWKFDQSSSNGGSNMLYPTPASVDAISQYSQGGAYHFWWMEAFLPDLGGQLWQFSFFPRNAIAGSWGGSLDPSTGLVKTCGDPTVDTNCFWGQREFAVQDPPPQQNLAQQFYFLPSSIWDPCGNLWLGLASGDDDNPLSCTPANYFYEFVQVNPYTPVTSVLTAANLTSLTGTGGFSTPMCGIEPGYPIVGWDIPLSSFSGTSTGAKSLNTNYSAYGIQYFGVFTPDPKACTGTSSQYNCQVIGGTGVVVSMAIDQLNGGQIKAGQVLSVVQTGSGIPSTPLLVTALYGGAGPSGGGGGGGGGSTNLPPSFGSAPILNAPLNPYTIPICNTGPGSLRASLQCIAATSGGVFTQCGTIQGSNSLVYPYYRTCVPQNEENNFLNPLNLWSLHPGR